MSICDVNASSRQTSTVLPAARAHSPPPPTHDVPPCGASSGRKEGEAYDDDSTPRSRLATGVPLLVELRLSRKRLLRQLGGSMRSVASEPRTAHRKLCSLQQSEGRVDDLYPSLNRTDLNTWTTLPWDWEQRAYAVL